MTSPKMNLPMLSPYLLGEAMSSHDGVTCYPAIRRGTDEKYIVKVISIPASQSKVEALLLTGALSDKDAALEYFMTLSKDVVNQTDILRQLSHQEGFIPYLDAQIQPIEGEVGYHVYLLGTYRQSLERIMRTDVMTHADVANLGLDLCAALAASRRTGYVYVDLKPGNIFRDPEQGFRIGDVGFIALSSLKYASLPEKYRSSYTAPELNDPMAVLNPTVDIYALGLVLYQAYNGGALPFEGEAPAEILPPPLYADYEMAQIILQACHPDPKQRWQDPTKMAHALIDYLQTFGAPEVPIIPPVLEKEEEEEPEEEPFEPEADPLQLQQEMEDLENADPDELAFLSGLTDDETAPNEENTADVPDDIMTEELSVMLAQADELIDHELPEPPVAPEPVFAPMPAPIVLDDQQDTPAEDVTVEESATEEAKVEPEDVSEYLQDTAEEKEAPPSDTTVGIKNVEPEKFDKVSFSFPWRIVIAAAVALLLVGVWFFGMHYYNNQYLLHVDDMILQNDRDTLTVRVVSDIEEGLLTVVCTDSYGNSVTQPVIGGVATFTQLNASTCYMVSVDVKGNHKLTGAIYDSFTTPAQTQILSFTAGIGPDDCSVALNFTVRGPETDHWTITYRAEGVEEKSVDFTGRSVIITDLAAGKHYTFSLSSPDSLYISGKTQVEFVASNILYAENLTITACGDGRLTAQWQQPTDGTVTEWQVRCYNEAGYNVTVTTTELSLTFTELDHSSPCTVEVTAVGMNDSVSTTISAEPVTVTDFTCTVNGTGNILVQWHYSGTAPELGWLLVYTVDGLEYSITANEPSVTLAAVPGGEYRFTICTGGGNFVFNSTHSCQIPEVSHFANYGITTEDLSFMPVLLPAGENWKADNFDADDYRIQFGPSEAAGILITSTLRPVESENPVLVEIVICTGSGETVSVISTETSWDDLWVKSSCLLAIPQLPQQTGSYSLHVFFDGTLVCSQNITVAMADQPLV